MGLYLYSWKNYHWLILVEAFFECTTSKLSKVEKSEVTRIIKDPSDSNYIVATRITPVIHSTQPFSPSFIPVPYTINCSWCSLLIYFTFHCYHCSVCAEIQSPILCQAIFDMYLGANSIFRKYRNMSFTFYKDSDVSIWS